MNKYKGGLLTDYENGDFGQLDDVIPPLLAAGLGDPLGAGQAVADVVDERVRTLLQEVQVHGRPTAQKHDREKLDAKKISKQI